MEVYIDILWKSSLSIAVFYSFYKVLLQNETFFKSIRFFLLVGIFISLLIPFLTITKHVEINTVLTQITPSSAAIGIDDTISNSNWKEFLLYSYLIITLLFITRFIFQVISIVKLVSQGNTYKDANINYVETNRNVSPFSFFNFIIYNPKHFTTHELEQILSHEKAHVNQKHSFDTLLANLLTTIQWFNPCAWLLKKEVCQNLEYSADFAALKKGNEPQSYQHLLLKTSIPNYQIALANSFYNSLLKKRIIMLQQQRSNSVSQWKFALILPLLIVFVFAFNVKTIAQQKQRNIVSKKIEIFEFVVDKTSTKEQLSDIITASKVEGLHVKFKGLKRNTTNEIIAITIDAKAKNGKASASHGSDLKGGISPIQLSFDRKNNHLSIGSTSERNLHGYSYSNKSSGSNYMFISTDDDRTNNDEEIIEIKTENNGNENRIILNSGNNKKEPMILLNGKEITKKQLEAVDSDSIKSINVYKGDKFMEKYGKKGENGVIKVLTKSNKLTLHVDKSENPVDLFDIEVGEPIYFIDGVESSKKYAKSLNRNMIESMSVFKGNAAITKYGKKGKNGVVVITLKKNKF
jgi:bla regulator protein BlaR1